MKNSKCKKNKQINNNNGITITTNIVITLY